MDPPTTRTTLLERLRNGNDEGAWRQFVTLYGPLVYGLARRHAMDPEACDALVQDFCVRALGALPRFSYQPKRGRFRRWILTVALNEIRQRKRAEASRTRNLERYRKDVEGCGAIGEDNARSWWDAAERRRMLELALERLRAEVSPDKFGLFHLVAVEGKPIGEVASFYGLRKPQVSLIKCRLLQRLRRIARGIERDWDES